MVGAKKTQNKLSAYRAKRDFKKTAEPSGQNASPKKGGLSYLIQKHAARRLHYDFRLELGGTLKSWAITRGPSLNPADKRLAVHVEDHPLDYGTFEGTIPVGQYGGGTVMMWDTGTWSPIGDADKSYKKGNLTFDLTGKRLKGRWHLVRMRHTEGKHENWLLIKGQDAFARDENGDDFLTMNATSVVTQRSMEKISEGDKVRDSKNASKASRNYNLKDKVKSKTVRKTVRAKKSAMPEFIEPQLATLVDAPPKDDGWVHEIKYDGYRLQAHINDSKVRLLTRSNNDWTHKFPSIASKLKRLSLKTAILDGEAVYQDARGTMSFHGLQNALSEKKDSGIQYFIFDILFLNGCDLRGLPLLERKSALASLLKKRPSGLSYSQHFVQAGSNVFEHACDMALEGIISKSARAPYHSGRDKLWLKSKCSKEQEMVIGGYSLQPKHPDNLAALYVGHYEGSRLTFGGKVGTGFTHEESKALLKKLRNLSVQKSPFVSVPTASRQSAEWVTPKLVAQIHFAEWTADGLLRHPSYQGLRADKPAREVRREIPKRVSTVATHVPTSSRPTPGPKVSDRTVVAGIVISHPDKIVFPDHHITKLNLVHYFEKVAPLMLPYIAGRPVSLMRCPEGEGKTCFFQRHLGQGSSPFIKTVSVRGRGDNQPFIKIDDERGLIALIQSGALEIHVWGSDASQPHVPDQLVFDLDPAPDVKFNMVKEAAKEVRNRLSKIKLQSFLKMTGGKGLHVVVPFAKGPTWPQAKEFSKIFSELMVQDSPDKFTTNIRKSARTTKIFIDYLRNGETASAIAPYSTRARPGAPVALPISWAALDRLSSGNAFTITHLPDLKKDPWKGFDRLGQRLPYL